LFEVHDAIKDLPGSTQARAFIIQRSLKYLDRISAASPGNTALRLELAEGYKRLGDVQGRANGANLGEYASAKESYRKAIALLQTMPDPGLNSTTDRKRRSLLATTQLRLGDYTNTTLAVQELEALGRAAKNDATIPGDLAAGYAAMADILVDRRDLPQALAYRLKELSLQKQILERDPNNIQSTRNYALASKKLGALLWKMRRPEEAMAYYQAALHLEEGWSALAPSSTEAKMAISYSHSDIGFLLREGGHLPESLAHYKAAVKIREESVAADPDNARAKLSLISAYWRTATVSAAAGDTRTSFSLLPKALAMLAQIKNPAPGSARNRIELANIYSVYAESYLAAGNRAAARSWYERSKKILIDLSHSGQLDANGADLLQSVEKELK
jgi:tetratricopeptide (TPR) repeat protein